MLLFLTFPIQFHIGNYFSRMKSIEKRAFALRSTFVCFMLAL
jgi:hypothetical protein